MTTFREYISELVESVSFTKDQKNELNHFILNVLMNPETARLLKKTKDDTENVTISKKDAKAIIDNLNKIRTFVLSLPRKD